MIPLNESLNGGYPGLFAEVVTYDCYRLKSLEFIPDIVFDLGANVGVFARFCQTLWPDAKVISVEPNPGNIAVFKHYTPGVTLIEAAIGSGEIWHNLGAANGSGESYVSKGLGYESLNEASEVSNVPAILPYQLLHEYLKPGQLSVLKMDIEGGETAVFQDLQSLEYLKQIDYLCFELHYYAQTHEGVKEVQELTEKALASFYKTHIAYEIRNSENRILYAFYLKKNHTEIKTKNHVYRKRVTKFKTEKSGIIYR